MMLRGLPGQPYVHWVPPEVPVSRIKGSNMLNRQAFVLDRFDAAAWFAAARAGNPRAVVAMNPGVATTRHEAVFPQCEDYLGGESNELHIRPVAALQDGLQWHGLIWIDCRWGHFEQPSEIEPPRFTDDELYDYLGECRRRGGGVTFNIGIYEDGSLAEASVAQLQRLHVRWQAEFGSAKVSR